MNDWYAGITLAVVVHGALFGMNMHQGVRAEYDVTRAQSSMEVSLVQPVPVSVVKKVVRDVTVTKMAVEEKPVIEEQVQDNDSVIPAAEKAVEKKDAADRKDVYEQEPMRQTQAQASNSVTGALMQAAPTSTRNASPIYPRVARERGYEGVVLLTVQVLRDGQCGSINITKSSGYSILDKAAVRAVKQWTFIPAMRGDETLTSSIMLPVRFELKNERDTV